MKALHCICPRISQYERNCLLKSQQTLHKTTTLFRNGNFQLFESQLVFGLHMLSRIKHVSNSGGSNVSLEILNCHGGKFRNACILKIQLLTETMRKSLKLQNSQVISEIGSFVKVRCSPNDGFRSHSDLNTHFHNWSSSLNVSDPV